MNLRFLLALLLLSSMSQAQEKKELSLKDAVLKQWTEYAPKRVNNLSWLIDRAAYSFLEEDSTGLRLSIQYLDSARTVEYISLKQLQASHSELKELKRMPRITWVSANSFVFQYDRVFFEYNLEDKQSFYLIDLPKEAENVDFNSENFMAAFTDGNNLRIGTIEGIIDVTKDSLEGIVNGQAVHRFEFGISKGTYWSPSGRYLAYYRKDERMVTDYPLVDITTKPAQLRSIKYPMAGDSSHQVSIRIIDVATQKESELLIEGPKDQYLTNIQWAPDEESIYVGILNRDQSFIQMNEFSRDSGLLKRTLFEEKDSIYLQTNHPMEFVPLNSGKFLWRSEADGFDHFYVHHIDSGLRFQASKGDFQTDQFLGFSSDNKSFFFTASTNNGMDRQVFRSSLDSFKQELITETSGVHAASYNSKANALIVSHTSLDNPLTTYLLDLDSMTRDTLIHNENPLDSIEFGTIEFSKLYTSDSTILNTRMIYPESFDSSKSYPVLLYVYNGPGVQLLTNRWRGGAPMWMNYMANKYDYLIYTVDGRGSENRGKDFEQVIFRQLGEVEMDDQFLGVDYLKSLPFVDSNRLAVHGWSYGGFMTTSLMMKRPGTFKVGVAGGPVIDWKYYEIMYTERYMDRPQDNPEGYAKASLLDKVDSLSGDLMLIHGSIDDVVVPQHSIDMLKKSVEAGVQLDFFLYPMHPHNVRGRDRIHLMEKVITYITEKMEKHAPAEVLPVVEKSSEATGEVDQEPSESGIKKTEPKKD